MLTLPPHLHFVLWGLNAVLSTCMDHSTLFASLMSGWACHRPCDATLDQLHGAMSWCSPDLPAQNRILTLSKLEICHYTI